MRCPECSKEMLWDTSVEAYVCLCCCSAVISRSFEPRLSRRRELHRHLAAYLENMCARFNSAACA